MFNWKGKKSSETGNWTRVSRVTGGNTNHYTISDLLICLPASISQEMLPRAPYEPWLWIEIAKAIDEIIGLSKSSIVTRTSQNLMYKLPIQKLQSSIYKQIFLII